MPLPAPAAAAAPMALPPTTPAPHDNAGITTENNGSSVQSNMHRKDAMLDTFTRRSFQVLFGFALLPSLLNVDDADAAADAGKNADEEGPIILGTMAVLSRRLLFDLGNVKARVDGRRLSNMASFSVLRGANELSRRADDDDDDMSSLNDVITEVGLIGIDVVASPLFIVVVGISSKCSSNVISSGW